MTLSPTNKIFNYYNCYCTKMATINVYLFCSVLFYCHTLFSVLYTKLYKSICSNVKSMVSGQFKIRPGFSCSALPFVAL